MFIGDREDFIYYERHYYNLCSYIDSYMSTASTHVYTGKGNSRIPRAGYEVGSDSKKTHEKYLALINYAQKLGNYLHKKSSQIYPSLSDFRQ